MRRLAAIGSPANGFRELTRNDRSPFQGNKDYERVLSQEEEEEQERSRNLDFEIAEGEAARVSELEQKLIKMERQLKEEKEAKAEALAKADLLAQQLAAAMAVVRAHGRADPQSR